MQHKINQVCASMHTKRKEDKTQVMPTNHLENKNGSNRLSQASKSIRFQLHCPKSWYMEHEFLIFIFTKKGTLLINVSLYSSRQWWLQHNWSSKIPNNEQACKRKNLQWIWNWNSCIMHIQKSIPSNKPHAANKFHGFSYIYAIKELEIIW